MSYTVSYNRDKAPKVGILINAVKAFSLEGKGMVENQYKELFESFKKEGIIAEDSIFYSERTFSLYDAEKVIEAFVKEMVDVVILLISAFPNGNAFLTLVSNPYLYKIPLVVTAPYEVELENKPEWTVNAWCGVIMNNYIAKRIGRYIYTLPGFPSDDAYRDKMKQFLNVAYTIKELRKTVIGRIGDAPSGFYSSNGNQLDYASLFGIRIETIDLTAVMNVYNTYKAQGLLKGIMFTEEEVKNTQSEMKKGRIVLVKDEFIYRAARLYHSLRAIIEANGFTSVSFRCHPEMNEPYIGIAPCFTLGWLLYKGNLRGAGCEGDWPITVMQEIGNLLTGKPSACLDFVDYTGKGPIVHLGHCGVGIPGYMAENEFRLEGDISEDIKEKILTGKMKVNEAIADKSPNRQAGKVSSPALIGQFKYGLKTGMSLIQDKDGKFKMLVFTGENSPETAKGILYAGCDLEVKNYAKLNNAILEYGFPHHLAVAFGDIREELKILCNYYGIEYILAD
ncbi:MAG: hypothetical protein N2380_10560 [bacterium]|nr:hypothetical protein [bacterium]